MKVLFAVDTFGPGGAQRSLQEMLPTFQECGIVPLLACFHRRAEGIEHLVLRDYDVRVLDGRSRLSSIRALRRIVVREEVDLVHTSIFEADIFGRFATAGTGVPVVTSLVNMPYEPARILNDPNVNKGKLLLARAAEIVTGALFADHFHAITLAVKDSAVKRLFIPPDRITVVHRGRDPARLGTATPERRARVRAALGTSEQALVVLNVARLEFQKGQVHLLEAFKEIADTNPLATLWIAGRPGNASSALDRSIASLGLGDRVRLLGHRDDAPDLMAAADIFALPSLWEGLGCVVLEALALGLPIVASDIPPVREVVTDGEGPAAVLVSPGSGRALAEGIQRIAANPALGQALGKRGRKLFLDRFTIQQSARGMVRLFERVAPGRR